MRASSVASSTMRSTRVRRPTAPRVSCAVATSVTFWTIVPCSSDAATVTPISLNVRKIVACVVAAGLAALVLAACGGGGDKKALTGDSDGSASSGSAATGSKSSFCTAAKKIEDEVGDKDITTDSSLAKKVIGELKNLKPPSEIASEWSVFVKDIDKIANTSSDDPALLSTFVKDAKEIGKVGTYLAKECGLSSFSDASDFTDLSDLTDSLSEFSDLSIDDDRLSSLESLASSFSDLSDFSDLSSLSSRFN